MKFRLYDWTEIVDEAGEKWEKYAIVKEWTITYDTPTKEILDMVEAVKDGNVDILTDRTSDLVVRADFDHLMEVLREAGWKFLDDPRYDWYNNSAVVFNSKFMVAAEYGNFETFIKEEMEKFKEMSKRWDYI
ncbi:MAG: hypothetical protein J6W35_07115 [Eubacterium sp.]|nr:hypothetical protein [Eubacterium sp.]